MISAEESKAKGGGEQEFIDGRRAKGIYEKVWQVGRSLISLMRVTDGRTPPASRRACILR